jgi:hypothetical protein
MSQGDVEVAFTLLNWIHSSHLSKNPPSPFCKGGTKEVSLCKERFRGIFIHFDEILT